MNITLLGTGNAAGMPLYGCECRYCLETIELNSGRRTPCCGLLKIGDDSYLVDAGQVDLADRFPAGSLAGILITHFHPDHVQGLFHLRWGVNLSIPTYTPPDSEGCADLYKHPGILSFIPKRKYQTFQLGGLTVTPLPLIHSKPTFGYLFEEKSARLAYLTDTKGLPSGTFDFLSQSRLDVLVIDCSYMPGYAGKGHNNLDDVVAIQKELKATKVVLTHIGHDFDIWLRENSDNLPAEFVVGFDGLSIDV